MKKRPKFTLKEQETLRKFLYKRHEESQSDWPKPLQNWPVPRKMGNFTVNQYESFTKYGDLATVIKFDNAIKLHDGHTTKRIGVGAIRSLGEMDVTRF